MEFSDFWNSVAPNLMIVFYSVAVAVGIMLVASVVFSFMGVTPKIQSKSFKQQMVLMLTVSILGAVAGVEGGMSRVGVVGDIVPAALALAGGVSVYLFGVKSSQSLITSLAVAVFALSLGLAYSRGAAGRAVADRYETYATLCQNAVFDSELLKDDKAFARFSGIMGSTCSTVLASDVNELAFVSDPSSSGSETEQKAEAFNRLITGLDCQLVQPKLLSAEHRAFCDAN